MLNRLSILLLLCFVNIHFGYAMCYAVGRSSTSPRQLSTARGAQVAPYPSPQSLVVNVFFNNWGNVSHSSLAAIDSKGNLIVTTQHGLANPGLGYRVNSISKTGVLNWQYPSGTSYLPSHYFPFAQAVIGANDEVFLALYNGTPFVEETTIYGFRQDGSLLPGFPKSLGSKYEVSKENGIILDSDKTRLYVRLQGVSENSNIYRIASLRLDGSIAWTRDYDIGSIYASAGPGLVQGAAGDIFNGIGPPENQRFIRLNKGQGTEVCNNQTMPLVPFVLGSKLVFSNDRIFGMAGWPTAPTKIFVYDENCNGTLFFDPSPFGVGFLEAVPDRLFFRYSGSIAAVSSLNGQLLWFNSSMMPNGALGDPPIVIATSDFLYVTGLDRSDNNKQKLFLLDSTTGETLALASLDQIVHDGTHGSFRLSADGTVYFSGGFNNGTIYQITGGPAPSSTLGRWAKEYGDKTNNEVASLSLTADGQGYMVAGTTEFFGDKDILLVKLNATGNLDWRRLIGGNRSDTAAAAKSTSDGGYIVTGTTESFGAGKKDIWVVKLNANGTVVWQHTFGGRKDDMAAGVELSPDGGYVIAGTTSSFGEGGKNIIAIKVDANGGVVWQRAYGRSLRQDSANAIHLTGNGDYIIAGTTTESLIQGISERGLTLRIDDGTGIPTGFEDAYFYIPDLGTFKTKITAIHSNAGGFLVTGNREPICPPLVECIAIPELWVAQLDSSGIPLWSKTVRAKGYSIGTSVFPSSDGGIIVAGATSSIFVDSSLVMRIGQGLVLKFDSQGEPVWQKTYGADSGGSLSFITPYPAGGYVLARTTYLPSSKRGATQGDFAIMKMDGIGLINSACPLDQTSSFTVSNAELLTREESFVSSPTSVTVKTPTASFIAASGEIRIVCQ